MKPIGEASGDVSPILSIIEELCVFFNTISGISRLYMNNIRCFDTPSILIGIRQRFLKPHDLLRRKPQTSPDAGWLEIAFVQEAVDGPRRDREIDRHLIDPEVVLQEG
jgi:hypothetical protein